MLNCSVHLYLESPREIALLEKSLVFPAMPRVGEFAKLKNSEMGDYFAFGVTSVTYREEHAPEIMLKSLAPLNEDELVEYVNSYVSQGWVHVSTKPNHSFNTDALTRAG